MCSWRLRRISRRSNPVNPISLSLRLLVSLIASGATGSKLEQLLSFLNASSLDDVHARCSDLTHSLQSQSEKKSGSKRRKIKKGNDDGGPKLYLANAVWADQLLPSYKKVLESVYNASSFQVDFINTEGDEIVREVNSWGEEKTNGLIKKVIPLGSVNEYTQLILANALYFKGKWLREYFEASETKDDNFHLLSRESVKVPFMRSHYDQFIGTYTNFQVLRLPYKGGEDDERQFSMLILLPKKKYGLAKLIKKVASGGPAYIDRHVPHMEVGVNKLRLPRFKISFGFEGSKIMKQFGLTMLKGKTGKWSVIVLCRGE